MSFPRDGKSGAFFREVCSQADQYLAASGILCKRLAA
jgi:hypothetical protein